MLQQTQPYPSRTSLELSKPVSLVLIILWFGFLLCILLLCFVVFQYCKETSSKANRHVWTVCLEFWCYFSLYVWAHFYNMSVLSAPANQPRTVHSICDAITTATKDLCMYITHIVTVLCLCARCHSQMTLCLPAILQRVDIQLIGKRYTHISL